jgi:hypothetical protein
MSSAAMQKANMQRIKYYVSELDKYLSRQALIIPALQFVSALDGEIISLRPWSDTKEVFTSYLWNVTLFPIDSDFLGGIDSMSSSTFLLINYLFFVVTTEDASSISAAILYIQQLFQTIKSDVSLDTLSTQVSLSLILIPSRLMQP